VGEFISVPRAPDGSVQLSETNFPILAGITPDGSDQRAVRLVFLVALGAMLFGLWRALGNAGAAFKSAKSSGLLPRLLSGLGGLFRLPGEEGPFARWRIVGLTALAVVLYLALPFDIRGYMYYLNTRYAHLVAALLVCSVPALSEEWSRRLVWLAAATALVLMLPLRSAFQAFDAESRALTELSKSAGTKPRVMGLVYATGSRAVTHPVYLHASCVVARERGGLTNFSFALTPHSPLMYRGAPPPTFPSEWRPDQMRWDEQGSHYDHFVLRGVRPEQVFGQRLSSELYVAAQAGDFFLVRRR
jgi:hypothetical protein